MNHTGQPVPPTTRIVEIGSHAARMDEPLVSFRLVEAAGRSPAPQPAFLFGPSNAAAARAIYGQIETPQTGCYALADAAVAPTGIGMVDGTAFCGAALNLPAEHVATISGRLATTALPVRFVPGPLVGLFGPAEESVAQLMVDYLPRLWLLEQAGYKLQELRFLVPATLPARVEELVAALGLRADQLVRYAHWEEVIRTDLLVLPTVLRQSERLSAGFGPATRLWVERVRAGLGLGPPAPRERLFVAGGAGSGSASGPDDRLQAEAVRAGYRVVAPDAMSLALRAASFSAASHIAGPYGAALHDSVFAAPGATVLAWRGEGQPGFLQTALCAAAGQSIGYVFAGDGGTIEKEDFRRGLELLDL